MNKEQLLSFILKAVALAMGITVLVLSILNELDRTTVITMLAIAIICISLSSMMNDKK